MNKKSSDNRHFDNWASTYDKSLTQKWFFQPVHMAMVNMLDNISEINNILDVGCGTGRLLRTVSNKYPSADMVGVDLSENMIAEAKKLTANATFYEAPAENIPIADQSIDLAFSSLSFHHWSDQSKGIQEIVRVLKSGGRLCFADVQMSSWLAKLFNSNAKTRFEIESMMQEAGLKTIKNRLMFVRSVTILLAQKP